jgi:hypothetical protein
MAAAFVAMNETFGPLYMVSRAEAATPEMANARAAALKGQFIMDMHTHFLRDDTRLEGFVRSREAVEHYVFPAGGPTHTGHLELHPLWPGDGLPKRRVLITGGASCPDGLIQQVVTRINQLWPADRLRSIDAVLAGLGTA